MKAELEQLATEQLRQRAALHQSVLDRIHEFVVTRNGEVDEEATTERVGRDMEREELCFDEVERGAEAFDRLLRRAEQGSSGQTERIATFLHSLWVGGAMPLDCLLGLDVEVSTDMLAALGAYTWQRLAVRDMAPAAQRRVPSVLRRFGLVPAHEVTE